MDPKPQQPLHIQGKVLQLNPRAGGTLQRLFEKIKIKKCIKASRKRGSFRSLPIDGAQACKLIPVPPNFLNQIDFLVEKDF